MNVILAVHENADDQIRELEQRQARLLAEAAECGRAMATIRAMRVLADAHQEAAPAKEPTDIPSIARKAGGA